MIFFKIPKDKLPIETCHFRLLFSLLRVVALPYLEMPFSRKLPTSDITVRRIVQCSHFILHKTHELNKESVCHHFNNLRKKEYIHPRSPLFFLVFNIDVRNKDCAK
jgi:hypothetical protein